jgi:2-oxoglutarate dehydrogenase E2 component (dihydrolipoamide succinyltransferase)/2-oxoisovalerate dehydrogenase E2 component (dihydrolipoyl transacylase)
MSTDIIMPQLGESVAEGTVVKWLVPKGEHVKNDQSLLEVETDKVCLEIPSPATGILTDILVQEGETVPVGTLLARLNSQPMNGVHGSVEAGPTNITVKNEEVTDVTPAHSSPAVRQLAKEYEVDLTRLTGTGTGGRITKNDVLDYLAKRETTQSTTMESGEKQSKHLTPTLQEEIIPLTTIRQTIAERMVHSRKASAHVVTVFEIDFSSIEKIRQVRKLTYLPFIVKAVTQALTAFPILNSSWSDTGIVMKHGIHIGIAVTIDEGLLVPVIRHADQKGLTALSKEIADLAYRARNKQLRPEEVQGGTFSITNHGGTGSLFSTPIIHQPQIAILGVGAVQKRPVVLDDTIAIRLMGYLSLSFDHRVIDGATADRFMTKLKDELEHEQ